MTNNSISSNENVLNEDAVASVTFEELGLPEFIVKAVTDIGFKNATPIQIQAIPALLGGRDILGLAQTGSGKTASFMLPLLANLDTSLKEVQILVLSPTRELADQVHKATIDFSKYARGIKSVAVFGGQPYGHQIRAIREGAQVVIATPGRLVDHLSKNTINLSHLKAVVLDEADEMLNMGFAEDLKAILEKVPETSQTALFSATMPRTIENLANSHLKDPEIIKIKKNKDNEPKIDQYYWLVNQYSKEEALKRFLEVEEYDAAIVFVKTKAGCNEVCEFLLKNNIAAACLHGDMSQEVRLTTINGLRNESINVLVATDVAARGLDIDRIDLVVNFDLPSEDENYVHRVGRTGRAGREGRSISFVGERERQSLYNIEKTSGKELQEITVPNNAQLAEIRCKIFKKALETKLNSHNLEKYEELVHLLIPEDYEPNQVLAALVNLATVNQRLVLPKERENNRRLTYDRSYYENRRGFGNNRNSGGRRNDRFSRSGNSNLNTYYFGVGKEHNLEVRQLIGVINSVSKGISIGNIRLFDTYSTVELPKDFNSEALNKLKDRAINGRKLQVRLFEQRNGGGYRNDRNFSGERRFDRRGGRNFDRNDRGGDRGERSEKRFSRDGGRRFERNDRFGSEKGDKRFSRDGGKRFERNDRRN